MPRRTAYRHNPEHRDYHYRRSYGISLAEYEETLEHQRGVCAICGSEPSGNNLDVDHDHETGRVRGLLCRSCNTKLGWLERNQSSIDSHLKGE